MSLKMSQRDKHIGVHNGAADLGVLHILAADHGNLHLIAALQPVADDDLAAGGHGVEAVEHGAVHVVQGVLAPAHIQGVAVGEERLTAPFLHKIRHGPRPIGAQERQVSRLAEVQLDGHELILKVDIAHTGVFIRRVSFCWRFSCTSARRSAKYTLDAIKSPRFHVL